MMFNDRGWYPTRFDFQTKYHRAKMREQKADQTDYAQYTEMNNRLETLRAEIAKEPSKEKIHLTIPQRLFAWWCGHVL